MSPGSKAKADAGRRVAEARSHFSDRSNLLGQRQREVKRAEHEQKAQKLNQSHRKLRMNTRAAEHNEDMNLSPSERQSTAAENRRKAAFMIHVKNQISESMVVDKIVASSHTQEQCALLIQVCLQIRFIALNCALIDVDTTRPPLVSQTLFRRRRQKLLAMEMREMKRLAVKLRKEQIVSPDFIQDPFVEKTLSALVDPHFRRWSPNLNNPMRSSR